MLYADGECRPVFSDAAHGCGDEGCDICYAEDPAERFLTLDDEGMEHFVLYCTDPEAEVSFPPERQAELDAQKRRVMALSSIIEASSQFESEIAHQSDKEDVQRLEELLAEIESGEPCTLEFIELVGWLLDANERLEQQVHRSRRFARTAWRYTRRRTSEEFADVVAAAARWRALERKMRRRGGDVPACTTALQNLRYAVDAYNKVASQGDGEPVH